MHTVFGSTSSFPFLDEHLETKRIELPVGIKTCIIGHLEIVSAEFRYYFDDAPLPVPWHRDPFNTEIDLIEEAAEELAELKVSNAMKLAFKNKEDVSSFWLSLHDSYPLLGKKASVMLVQFATTYLCESGFSDLATIKTKSRNRLDVRSDIRLAEYKRPPQTSPRASFALIVLVSYSLTLILFGFEFFAYPSSVTNKIIGRKYVKTKSTFFY